MGAISTASPARHSAFLRIFFFENRKARQWRAFANWRSVSRLRIGQFQRKIADSLRQTVEKLTFLGDGGWRPGSICTARPAPHSYLGSAPVETLAKPYGPEPMYFAKQSINQLATDLEAIPGKRDEVLG